MKQDASMIGDGFWNRIGANYNRGPCGIPKNTFGTSPYTVGTLSFQNYCNSHPEDCMKCPMNPNTKENKI